MSQQKRNNKSLKNEEEENKDNEVWANSSLIHTIAKILTEIINDNFKSSDGNEGNLHFNVFQILNLLVRYGFYFNREFLFE